MKLTIVYDNEVYKKDAGLKSDWGFSCLIDTENENIPLWYWSKRQDITKGETFDEAKDWILKLKPNKIIKGVVEIRITDIYSITPTREEAGMRII